MPADECPICDHAAHTGCRCPTCGCVTATAGPNAQAWRGEVSKFDAEAFVREWSVHPKSLFAEALRVVLAQAFAAGQRAAYEDAAATALSGCDENCRDPLCEYARVAGEIRARAEEVAK